MQRQHGHRHGILSRRQSTAACVLYTDPTLNSIQPVLTNINLTWNTACLPSFTATTADLYLSVLQPTGLLAVKLWPAVNFKSGRLATQFNPSWWNATGAGSIEAQLAFTGAGSPIWDTSAPSSPIFEIRYNGTYPSATAASFQPASTGPAVQSSDSAAASPSISSGALGAAVAIPIVVLGCLVAAYIIWNRRRKQPEKKRWSAAIEQRMSMMSEGTWQPPRPSTSSARPGSTFERSSQAPASMLANGSMTRSSQFYADGRPASAYSASNGTARLPPSPNPNGELGEMRQIGNGDRVSRVSFMGGARPPLIGPGGKSRSSIYTNRNSTYGINNKTPTTRASVRTSTIGSAASDEATSPAKITPAKKSMPRSGTTEELSNEAFVGTPSPRSSPASSASPSSSPLSSTRSLPPRSSSRLDSLDPQLAQLPAIAMMNERRPRGAPAPLVYDTRSSPSSANSSPSISTIASTIAPATSNDEQSPFADPFLPAPVVSMSAHMPMAARDSLIMSPDEALRSYAVKRDAAASLPTLSSTTTLKSKPSLAFLKVPSLVRSASSFLKRNKNGGEEDDSSMPDGNDIVQPPVKVEVEVEQSRNHYTDNDSYNNPPPARQTTEQHVEYENPRSSPIPPTSSFSSSSISSPPRVSTPSSQRIKAPIYVSPSPAPLLPTSTHMPTAHLPTSTPGANDSNRGDGKDYKTMTMDTIDSVYSDDHADHTT